MSYTVSYTDLYRRAAVYVDKILKGQTRRSTRRTANEVRVHHQFESRQANRPDHSTERAGTGGQSDQVKRGASEECEVERAGKHMKRKITVFALCAMLFALCASAEAQQAKIPRIGILSTRSPGPLDIFDAFHQGLRDLGYVEGKNIIIEYRFAEEKYDRLPALMAELMSLNPDVILTHTTPGALAAKRATTTIPIVIGAASDLVEQGIVGSLARPGGNITGLTFVTLELDNKRLELLKEAVPKVFRVAVLVNPANPAWNSYPSNMEDLARTLGVHLRQVEARNGEEIETAFSGMTKTNVNALLSVNDTVFDAHRRRIVDLAAKNRLPAIAERREFSEEGGLIAYGVDIPHMFRRASVYVDKILKGTKPSDLPIERPSKFEFVINLKTAKQIGVTIPQSVLFRADKVIK
jgi:putative tryptophan/tyrosine transport system substrate-binding protein